MVVKSLSFHSDSYCRLENESDRIGPVLGPGIEKVIFLLFLADLPKDL